MKNIDTNFHRTAESNATRVGLHKHTRKADAELRAESFSQDKVSLGEHIDNAKHVGLTRDLDRDRQEVSDDEHKIVDPYTGRPLDEGNLIIDPKTGRPVNPDGPMIIDPNTGKPLDMGQNMIIDPNTGKPVDLEHTRMGGICPVPQPDINPYLQQLVDSGKISKEELQAILDLDSKRREEEQMMVQHDMKERQSMKDAWLTIWGDAQKAEHERMKTFMAIMDAIRAIDASIAANKLATNKGIQAEWYKAMFS